MQTPPTSRLKQRLDWARDQMGVPPGASLEDARRRFFTSLQDENFVPDQGLDRAFRTLRWEAEGVIDADDPPEFLAAEERELREEIERFAAKMFSLSVEERRRRWAALHDRSDYAPRMRARLDSLALGLDADWSGLRGGERETRVIALARYAAELFPLSPTARAVRRHALVQKLSEDDIKAWRKAAQTLKKKHPQLAALAPELIDILATWGQPRRLPSPVAVPRGETSQRGPALAMAIAACIFLSFLVRTAVRLSENSRRPPPPPASEMDSLLDQLRENSRSARRSSFAPTPSNAPGDGAEPFFSTTSPPRAQPSAHEILRRYREEVEARRRAALEESNGAFPSRPQTRDRPRPEVEFPSSSLPTAPPPPIPIPPYPGAAPAGP